ncbi:thiamine phosphate synthase [Anaerosporomusa subterranea]|nr:thiamine phosphate synthase [Anaerosporomusa subterranea]
MNGENDAAMNARRIRARDVFQSAGLYCLTDSKLSCGRNNLTIVEQMLSAGLRIVQYREKNQSQLTMYKECLAIRDLTRSFGATFIVNDDIALAMAVCADGVHVGQDDLPVPAVRLLVGESMLIGLSTHTPEQAQAAVRLGADYIGVGPVYSTLTKKDVGNPVGLSYVDYVAKNIALASVAIGGINAANVAEVIRHGADCAAMISDIVSAADISQQIQLVQTLIKQARRLRG